MPEIQHIEVCTAILETLASKCDAKCRMVGGYSYSPPYHHIGGFDTKSFNLDMHLCENWPEVIWEEGAKKTWIEVRINGEKRITYALGDIANPKFNPNDVVSYIYSYIQSLKKGGLDECSNVYLCQSLKGSLYGRDFDP